MAWRRPGDKPFSEPMMVSLLILHLIVSEAHSADAKYMSPTA